MRQKLLSIVNKILESVPHIGDFLGLIVMENTRELYDPYFIVSIDVYLRGRPVPVQVRQALFEYGGAFEATEHKDRFLIDEMPVRIEYRDIDHYEGLKSADYCAFVQDSFALRRLVSGTIMQDSQGILESLRAKALELPATYWNEATNLVEQRLDHALEDMKSASVNNDELLFSISKARVLEQFVALLCSLNRRFLPSPRDYANEILELNKRPDDFLGRIRTLLSWSAEPISRQTELAELIVEELLAFSASIRG
jgi:hypothetical protein